MAIFKKRNGERGMRLTIFHDKCFSFDEALYSAQIEGAEFNGDDSFL